MAVRRRLTDAAPNYAAQRALLHQAVIAVVDVVVARKNWPFHHWIKLEQTKVSFLPLLRNHQTNAVMKVMALKINWLKRGSISALYNIVARAVAAK